MSVRYKIILSLSLLTAICLGVYIWIAKSVFEKDKQLAIFESANQTSGAQAYTFKQQLDGDLSFVTSLIGTYDPQIQSFSEVGADLFNKRQDVVFIAVLENSQLLVFQSKDPQLTQNEVLAALKASDAMVISLGKPGLVAVSTALKVQEEELPRKLVIGVDLKSELEILSFESQAGGSFLTLNEKPLSLDPDFPNDLALAISSLVPVRKNMSEQTLIEKVEGREFLIAAKDVQFGGFRILTVIPKDVAFQGLSILYKKSLQFYGLIFFIVLIVSVVMTNALLKNLDQLTRATEKVSKGNFDFKVGVESKDEFGSLASSFQRMSQEIKRLIVETKEKARMETELKTAQTVQENLFPEKKHKNSMVEIDGLYRPASECGGDWWYYFEHLTGVYIFICDATGHGAPAALITAAAKATVNLMKREKELDLVKLAESFNYALYETAKGNLLMTGFVVHVKLDGSLEYINASHEPPLLFSGESDIDFLVDPIGPRFGQSPKSEYGVGRVDQVSGKFLLLYTDGITGQKNSEEKELGDRRFTRFLIKTDVMKTKSSVLNERVFALVDEFRDKVDQGDDLTIVSLRFP